MTSEELLNMLNSRLSGVYDSTVAFNPQSSESILWAACIALGLLCVYFFFDNRTKEKALSRGRMYAMPKKERSEQVNVILEDIITHGLEDADYKGKITPEEKYDAYRKLATGKMFLPGMKTAYTKVPRAQAKELKSTIKWRLIHIFGKKPEELVPAVILAEPEPIQKEDKLLNRLRAKLQTA